MLEDLVDSLLVLFCFWCNYSVISMICWTSIWISLPHSANFTSIWIVSSHFTPLFGLRSWLIINSSHSFIHSTLNFETSFCSAGGYFTPASYMCPRTFKHSVLFQRTQMWHNQIGLQWEFFTQSTNASSNGWQLFRIKVVAKVQEETKMRAWSEIPISH